MYIILGLVSSFQLHCRHVVSAAQLFDKLPTFSCCFALCVSRVFLYITVVVLVLVPPGPATFDLYTVA